LQAMDQVVVEGTCKRWIREHSIDGASDGSGSSRRSD
jgi:hypothetical protein